MEEAMRVRLSIFCMGLAAGLLAGCATFPVQNAYEAARSAHEAALRIEIGPETRGVHSVHIKAGLLVGAVLSGQAVSDNAGGWEVSLTSLGWFNNWQNGWTEAAFVLDGTFDLVQSGSGWSVRIKDSPEIVAPASATIHYYTEYFNGDIALEQFSRRWNRIEACAGFLRSRFGGSWFEDQRGVRKFLFPELYGYTEPPDPHHASVTAESIAWNADYTGKEFPENIRALRDSGTMLRDFEESPGLWELAFHWTDLWNKDIPARVFSSIKL